MTPHADRRTTLATVVAGLVVEGHFTVTNTPTASAVSVASPGYSRGMHGFVGDSTRIVDAPGHGRDGNR